MMAVINTRPNAFVEPDHEPEFDGPGTAVADLLEDMPKIEPQSPNLEQLTNYVLEDNGAKRTPEDWFDYYSKLTGSSIMMASAGDFYQCWKQLKQIIEQSNPKQKTKAQEMIVSFREDFDWSGKKNYLVSGTRLEYNADNLETTIIQHYGCKRKELIKTTSLEVEEYLGVSIADVTSQNKGLRYLQTVFDTIDDAETIIRTLEFISNKRMDQIKIWTPPINHNNYRTRRQHSNRAVGFDYYGGDFHFDGYYVLNQGRSRRVDVGAAAGGASQNSGVPGATATQLDYETAYAVIIENPQLLNQEKAAGLSIIVDAYLSNR